MTFFSNFDGGGGRKAMIDYANGDNVGAVRAAAGGIAALYTGLAALLGAAGTTEVVASLAASAGVASPPGWVLDFLAACCTALALFFGAIAAGGDVGNAVVAGVAGAFVAAGVVSQDDLNKTRNVVNAMQTPGNGVYRSNRDGEMIVFRTVLGRAVDATRGGIVSPSQTALRQQQLEGDRRVLTNKHTLGTHSSFVPHKADAFFTDWENAGKPVTFWRLVALLKYRFSGAKSVVDAAIATFPNKPLQPPNVPGLRGNLTPHLKPPSQQGSSSGSSGGLGKLAAAAAAAAVVAKVAGVI